MPLSQKIEVTMHRTDVRKVTMNVPGDTTISKMMHEAIEQFSNAEVLPTQLAQVTSWKVVKD